MGKKQKLQKKLKSRKKKTPVHISWNCGLLMFLELLLSIWERNTDLISHSLLAESIAELTTKCGTEATPLETRSSNTKKGRIFTQV